MHAVLQLAHARVTNLSLADPGVSNWSGAASMTRRKERRSAQSIMISARWHKKQKNLVLRNISGTLSVPFVWSDGKMKAGLGEIIFNVGIWVAVIVPWRSGLQELSGEESGVAKTKAQPTIHRVFGNQIEFVADVTAGTGVRGNRNRSAAGVKIVI